MNHPRKSATAIDRTCMWSMMVLACIGLSVGSASLHAQTRAQGAQDALPYNDPQPLQELLKLNDAQLQTRLSHDWVGVRKTLDRFYPPGSVVTMPRAFSGSQSECLRKRAAPACRVYVNDLVQINKERRPQGGLLSNPLGS